MGATEMFIIIAILGGLLALIGLRTFYAVGILAGSVGVLVGYRRL